MNLLYTICFIPLGLSIFWALALVLTSKSYPLPPELKNKSILLLIAHPDDEAMFFGPSILSLSSSKNRNHIKILCLSTGNATGQGEVRREELLNSARQLGVNAQDDVQIVEDSRFQDGQHIHWKSTDVASMLGEIYGKHSTPLPAQKRCSKTRLTNTSEGWIPTPPDVILTFDSHGVSLHPNHKACYTGALQFLRQYQHDGTRAPSLYTLSSVSILRKYAHVLDILYIACIVDIPSPPNGSRCQSKGERVVLVSNFAEYARTFGAMVHAHRSQMLWFRWGWILVGRYMLINDLKRQSLRGYE